MQRYVSDFMIEAKYVLFLAGTLVGAIMLQKSSSKLIEHYVTNEIAQDPVTIAWSQLTIALLVLIFIVLIAIMFEHEPSTQ
jgi:ABC-type Mn2+/Zn2+ transport system permease subunit